MTLKNARKGHWVISPDYRTSHPRCFCAVGDDNCSKIWCPSGLTLRCMPWGKGMLRNPLRRIFVVRKARTIALSEAQGTQQSTLFTNLEIPWGFHTRAVLRSLARLMSCKKVSVRGFLWVRKVWLAFSLTDVCMRDLQQKAERGKITGSEYTTRFSRASCFKKPTRSVPEIWGRMYDVLARSAKGTKKQDKKSDSRAAKKGANKLVSSNFVKN